MKKLFILLIGIISLLMVNVEAKIELPEKTDHEKVTMYLFYSKTCPHCHDFINYFQSNYKDEYKDYFEIVALEAGSEGNGTLFQKVSEHFGNNTGGQIPYIIVGDYSTLGFSDSKGPDLVEQALKQYQNSEYKDVVDSYGKDIEGLKKENLQDAARTAGLKVIDTSEDKDSIPDGVIIAIIFVIVIGGLGGLIYIARKK